MKLPRRRFVQGMAATAGAALVPSCAHKLAAERLAAAPSTSVASLLSGVSQPWLGEAFWGNRLQDWQLNGGWIECLNGEQDWEVRTVALLTRQLNDNHGAAHLRARTKLLTPGAVGFCGFLLGVGQGQLDYRGAALAQRTGGEGGGFMAVMDEAGKLSFRDFSDQSAPLDYALYEADNVAAMSGLPNEVLLDCHIDPVDEGRFDVRLIASDAESGEEIGFCVRAGVRAEDLIGGISLVSSPPKKQVGARWAFKDIESGGPKIDAHDAQSIGPVMGCMHSLNRTVLRLSAQFMPVDSDVHPVARFDYRRSDESDWTQGPVEPIGDGFMALFRVEGWDPEVDHDYRIVYPDAAANALFDGQIVKDPGSARDLKIALYSCILPSAKHLDREDISAKIPQERTLGRYRPENVLFPHNQLVANCDTHEPDLYVFCGDQYYENYPTRDASDGPEPKLDTLYRWYLWYWTFRESVRSRPAIMLADDHDVLQGNLWGKSGDETAGPREEDGGFKHGKDVVRMVYRIQHGHNPDPFDPTPIEHNIPVAYASFVYGGTSFALVEDRKFKTPPITDIDPLETRGDLLGQRQEDFLKAWAEMDPDLPKVCLTASIWGSPQTVENVKPLLDFDSNGFPPDGRTRAVKLVRDAKALVLAGDQHLAMIAHQGVDSYDDGALFFAGPAAAAFWQRWFEGLGALENQRGGDPNTGDFVDTFGNKMRVLAVANPKVTYEEFVAGKKGWGNFVADRAIKSEGYGIVRVQHSAKSFLLECWPWDAPPQTAAQFDGWPYEHPFG